MKNSTFGQRALARGPHIAMAIATLLAGCARGGGIGLEAMLADSTCEQRGFHLGTPEYANCRAQIGHHQGMVNAGMQAQLQRENAELMARNRQQTCFYNGSPPAPFRAHRHSV